MSAGNSGGGKGSGGGDNYYTQHSSRHHHLPAPDSGSSPRGLYHQQQVAANPQLTTMTGANGLPRPSNASTKTTSALEPASRQVQHSSNNNNNNNNNNNLLNFQSKGYPRSSHQAGQLQQQQHQQQQAAALRHFYGPAESMTMQRADGEQRARQAVFAADQSIAAAKQQLAMSMGRRGEAHASQLATDAEQSFNTSTARSRAERLYPEELRQAQQQQQQQHPPHQRHGVSGLHQSPGQSSPQHYQYQNNSHHSQHQHRHAKQMPIANQERGLSDCPPQYERRDVYEQRPGRPDQQAARLEHEQHQDQHANRLRSGQQQRAVASGFYSSTPAASSSSASRPRPMQASQQRPPTSNGGQTSDNRHQQQRDLSPQARESLHVNFNRSSQRGANETDEDESGESTRKKKYLTAKYGQQQMNLIKKRLKIEMWLHDQLQELAKQSKSIEPDELDEIDIDLDQLLDMEDEPTRRHWLRKTLEPLNDLPNESIEKFIGDVLDQSKLL